MTAMERNEPALAPQWLRAGSGGSGSSGNASHSNQQPGFSSRAVDRGNGTTSRNRLSLSASDHDSVDGTSSSNSRRSTSTSGSIGCDRDSPIRIHTYNSFGWSYRDRDREKDYNHHKKERLPENGFHDIFDNIVAGRDEKGNLLRSQSMITRRQNESFPKKVRVESIGVFPPAGGSSSSIHKASFDRDFPSLGSDERQSSHEIGRVSSPGPNMAPASILLGNSTVIGGDGWTSVLADVPAVSMCNGTTLASVHLSSSASTASSVLTANNGLNMAETLAQSPLRARAAPELSMETQRLEELAIKQSRQLIPVTPSASKTVVLNSSEKLKKGVRSGDTPLMPKVVPQSLSQSINTTIRGIGRSEASKGPQVGNFQVLNRDRNCLAINSKETPYPTNASRVVSLVGAPGSADVPSKLGYASGPEMKPRTHPMFQSGPLDKKPLPRSQDRTDFFNSLRKKVNANHMNTCQEKYTILSAEKSDEQIATTTTSDCQEDSSLAHPYPVHLDTNGNCECRESKLCSIEKVEDDTSYFLPTEEEFKFLRELGWKEDERVEHITDEEIASFRSKHMSKVPSSALCPSVLQQ